jgi:hypothetical protein
LCEWDIDNKGDVLMNNGYRMEKKSLNELWALSEGKPDFALQTGVPIVFLLAMYAIDRIGPNEVFGVTLFIWIPVVFHLATSVHNGRRLAALYELLKREQILKPRPPQAS